MRPQLTLLSTADRGLYSSQAQTLVEPVRNHFQRSLCKIVRVKLVRLRPAHLRNIALILAGQAVLTSAG